MSSAPDLDIVISGTQPRRTARVVRSTDATRDDTAESAYLDHALYAWREVGRWLEVSPAVEALDFTDPDYRAIFDAWSGLRAAGKRATAADVERELLASGAAHASTLARQVHATAADRMHLYQDPATFADMAGRIVAARRHRDAVRALDDARTALVRGDAAEGWETKLLARLGPAAGAVESADALALLDVDALFAPLPPVPWLVKSLDIAPGAPVLLAGYGFSGKTLAAQSMALSVAGGGPVWGSLSLGRRGRVVHVDYEQGARLTSERYQRLARARDIGADDLRGLLSVACLPTLHLSDAKAFDVLCRVLDGCALAIFDSLRASAPDLDENSSEVRRILDLLTLVSEKTGCVPLVIHHARKPREDATGGARMAIRGSSAIFDACSSVLVFDGQKGEPVTVVHDKARTSGICSDDLALEVRDVELDGDPRAGLEVRVVGCEPPEVRQAARARVRLAALDDAVLDFVRRNPGATVRAVRGNVDGTNSNKDGALERLMVSGLVQERPGAKGARTFWPAIGGSHE